MTELLVLNVAQTVTPAVSLDGSRVRTLVDGLDEFPDGVVVDSQRGLPVPQEPIRAHLVGEACDETLFAQEVLVHRRKHSDAAEAECVTGIRFGSQLTTWSKSTWLVHECRNRNVRRATKPQSVACSFSTSATTVSFR
jgi:hypothetical protein